MQKKDLQTRREYQNIALEIQNFEKVRSAICMPNKCCHENTQPYLPFMDHHCRWRSEYKPLLKFLVSPTICSAPCPIPPPSHKSQCEPDIQEITDTRMVCAVCFNFHEAIARKEALLILLSICKKLANLLLLWNGYLCFSPQRLFLLELKKKNNNR